MTGAVVGINSSIRTGLARAPTAAGSIGLGFAIPIDEVMPIVDQMIAGETPTHARLGIQVGDAGTAADGADGAAGRRGHRGLRPPTAAGLESGDVITRVDDRAVTDADSLVATIRSYRPGDEVEVTWQRDGEEQTADAGARLGRRHRLTDPTGPPAPIGPGRDRSRPVGCGTGRCAHRLVWSVAP